MRLLEKLKETFLNRTEEMPERPRSLFDRLRNIFFSTEFLANDLDRVPSECKCGDALAHLDGRCTSCATASAETETQSVHDRKGCSAQIDELRVDVRNVRQALHRRTLQPEEETRELKQEMVQIEYLVDGLASVLESLKSDATDFQATCSSEVLGRLKKRSKELRAYSSEFFWTVTSKDRQARAARAGQNYGG
jgi:hypothetical protein